MPKTSTHHHLYLNHQTWMFRFRWPKDVIEEVNGQKEFHKSLQTSVLQEAMSERDILYAHCKKMVKKIRSENRQKIEDEKSRFQRLWLTPDEDISDDPDVVDHYRHELYDEARGIAMEKFLEGKWDSLTDSDKKNLTIDETLEKLGVDKQVNAYMGEVMGDKNFLAFDLYKDEWLQSRQVEVTQKTLDDGKLTILKFKKSFPTIGSVKTRTVKKWFDNQKTSISQKRLKTYKSHLQSYWSFLKHGLDHLPVDENLEPFREISFRTRKNGTEGSSKGWESFPNLAKDIILILNASKETGDQKMVDLILLDMYTGMRIEEACALKVEDVKDDYIHISESKTNAGIREIPIHSQLQQPLERMIQDSRDGYVISGLTSNNKYNNRSDAIGKRFGRLKTKLGFGPKHVFHSFRETVITMFEQAGVVEGIVADIVGHKKQTITYGVYSGGTSMQQKKEAIETLVFPDKPHP